MTTANVVKLRPELGDDLIDILEEHKDSIVSLAMIAIIQPKEAERRGMDLIDLRAYKPGEQEPYLVLGGMQALIAQIIEEEIER